MSQFKYFTQEGSLYKFKPQTVYKIVIMVLLLALSIFCWKADITFLVLLFCTLAVMIIFTLFTDKFEIDTQSKMIYIRQGIYMQTRNVPFDKIVTFEMLTTTTNFVRSSVALNLYYLNDNDKEKVIKVAQGISKTHMQKILNEIDEIMGHE